MDQLLRNPRLAQAAETAMAMITAYGLKVIGAIVILIVGWIAAGAVQNAVLKVGRRSARIDHTLTTFAASTAKYAVVVFTLIAMLGSFGVETTSFVAVLGAVGLAIGLALQGTLSHVASGLLLVMFRPFRIGDMVEAGGVTGTVEAITLFTTEIATADNVKAVVPNGKIWGGAILVFSTSPTRRIELEVTISYADSIARAMQAMQGVIAADRRILTQPAPMLLVSALADNAVRVMLRVWVQTADVDFVRSDLLKGIKESFGREGITIPVLPRAALPQPSPAHP